MALPPERVFSHGVHGGSFFITGASLAHLPRPSRPLPAILALLALMLPSVPRLTIASDLPIASDGAFRRGATPLAIPTPSSPPPTASDIQFVNGTGGDLDPYLYRPDLTPANGHVPATLPFTS